MLLDLGYTEEMGGKWSFIVYFNKHNGENMYNIETLKAFGTKKTMMSTSKLEWQQMELIH